MVGILRLGRNRDVRSRLFAKRMKLLLTNWLLHGKDHHTHRENCEDEGDYRAIFWLFDKSINLIGAHLRRSYPLIRSTVAAVTIYHIFKVGKG